MFKDSSARYYIKEQEKALKKITRERYQNLFEKEEKK